MRHDVSPYRGPGSAGHRPGIHRVCALIITLCITSIAAAENALIVLSSGSGAYKTAAAACAERLRSGGWRSETVLLDGTDADAIRAAGYTTVVTFGASASAALAGKTGTPVVYGLAPDPESLGLTTQDNVSGVSSGADISEEYRLISSVLPKARAVGVLVRGGSSRSATLIGRIRAGMPAGWRIEAVDLDDHRSVSDGIRALFSRNIDAAWMIPDPAVYDSAVVKALLLEAIRTKIPVIGFSTKLARSGALLGIGVNPAAVGEAAAEIVLRGESGRHEHPTPVFALNSIVADKLGITLSQTIRLRAAQVYDAD